MGARVAKVVSVLAVTEVDGGDVLLYKLMDLATPRRSNGRRT